MINIFLWFLGIYVSGAVITVLGMRFINYVSKMEEFDLEEMAECALKWPAVWLFGLWIIVIGIIAVICVSFASFICWLGGCKDWR